MQHPTTSYVSRLLESRMQSGLSLTEPAWERKVAAVMLGDLVGSTALARHFASAGPNGLEQFTWSMNAYLSEFVDIVDVAGGDVLYIAGDAFLCYWPAESHSSLKRAAAWASEAALQVQQALHDKDAGLGQRFRMRIGVGAGELTTAFLGGYNNRWQLVTLGAALVQAIHGERSAPPGGVLASDTVVDLLGESAVTSPGRYNLHRLESVRIEARPGPQPPRVVDAVLEQSLRPYLPAAVLDRAAVPDPQWLAESRAITALIVDLASLGNAEVAAERTTDGAVRIFQEVMSRFEGSVKIDVDDKGVLLLGVFGLPPMVHEDSAERAINAAWELRERLTAIGVERGCGIATGRAICGSFGSDLRREYMVRGEVINRAARLMHTVANGPVCDRTTTQAVRGRFSFNRLRETPVDTAPYAAFLPIARASSPVTGSLVGREDERAVLAGLIAKSDREPTVAAVVGDAGLGKTTLLQLAIRTAARNGVPVLECETDSVERRTAYFAWRPVFRSILDVSPEDSAAQVLSAVESAVERAGMEKRLAPLASIVMPTPLPDNALTADMQGEVRGANTANLLCALLVTHLSHHHSLVVLDDAQLTDHSSLALLHMLLDEALPGMVLVGSRPPDANAAEDHLTLLERAETVLSLAPLSPDATGQLIRLRLRTVDVPDALLALIAERSEGNPFYTEELTRAMLATGSIKTSPDGAVATTVNDVEVPISVESAILSALDQLPSDEQLSLKVASVIGHGFSGRIVRDVWPVGTARAQVTAHLDALVERGMLVRTDDSDESGYRFKHVIMRDVTYGLMPPAQQRLLHGAVATWYEARVQTAGATTYALLAHHFERALVTSQALKYALLAGEQANRDGAFADARAFFERCIALSDGAHATEDSDDGAAVSMSSPEKARVLHGLGLAHYFSGSHTESRQFLEDAVALLDKPVPRGGLSVATGLLGNVARQLRHRMAPPGKHTPEPRKSDLDRAVDCYKVLCQIYYLAGEPAPNLLYANLRGLNVGEIAGPSVPLAAMLQNMAVMTSLMGMKPAGRGYAERAIEMAGNEGQFAAAGYVWHIHAIQLAQDGDWNGALAASDTALALLTELDDRGLLAESYVVRATVLLASGDFNAAPDAWRRARELAVARANRQIECWTWLDEVDQCVGIGDVSGARAALDNALAIPTAETDGSSTIDKLRATATTCMLEENWDAAFEAADEVVRLVTRQPPSGYHWVDYFASATDVYLSALERGAAFSRSNETLKKNAAHAVKHLRRLARTFWNVKARAHTAAARLAVINNNFAEARKHLAKADDVVAELNMPFEGALASMVRARVDTDAADTLLTAAGATFTSLGAMGYVEACETARNR